MKNNLVSIITPIYNASPFLEKLFETVTKQTYKNWELILINDCSKDDSLDKINKLIKQYNKYNITVINLKNNSGAAIARNEGIKNSKGKYIAFLDADDYWTNDKLEVQVNFMKKNNYEFTYTDYQYINIDGNLGNKVIVPQIMTYKKSLKNTTIWTSTVMLDVSKLGKDLIYMPNVKRGQDTATWWKILKTGITAHGLNKRLAFYVRSNNTLSANKFTALKRTWNLYRNVEKFGILKSSYYFMFYVFNAIKRRV